MSAPPADEVFAAPERHAQGDGPGDRPAGASPPVAAVQPPMALPEPGTDPLSDQWAQWVAQLNAQGAVTALVRELAMQAQCVGQAPQAGGEGLRLQLRVQRESLRTEPLRDRLAQALSALLGHEVSLSLDAGTATNTPAQRDQVARERKQQAAQHLIASDPLVSSLLKQYPGARIVPGSIQPL